MLVALQESETEEGAVPLEDPDFQVGAFPGHVPEEVRSFLGCARCGPPWFCVQESGHETEETADGNESQACV